MSALPAEFGITVGTDVMAPVYDRGDTLLCKASSSLQAGRDYLIAAKSRRPTPESDVAKAIMRIARIERLTATHLFSREFNPPRVRRLSRKKWQAAARVTGVYRAQ